MKRPQKLLLLSLSLVILCVLTFWIQSLDLNGSEEDSDTLVATIFSLNAEDITALKWTYNDETMAFTFDGSVWSYQEDNAFPVDSTLLDAIVTVLSDITSTKTIENVENYSQYGLEEAICKVNVTTDTTYELLIGNETGLGSERYFSIGDGNVYLVDSGILDEFAYSLYDFVLKESLPVISDIDSINVVAKTHNLQIYHDKESTLTSEDGTAYFWFAKDDSSTEDVALDTSLVDTFTSTLTGLSWVECVNYRADEESLAAYGLDAPIATVTINYIETTEIDTGETDENGVNIFENEETLHTFVFEIGDYSETHNYARIQGSDMVYLINSTICDTLLQTTYESLMTVEETTDTSE